MACASVLSQYSPFFTSGLLTSTLPREASSKPVRRSEPLTVNTHNIYSNSRAPHSAVDLSHRDRLQSGHSFLTLDLTEPYRGSPSPSRRTLTSQRSVPILRQSARENLRIPSPKPAPSVSLPTIPQESLRDSTSVSEYSQAGPSQHLSIPTGASTPTADESYLFISPLASPRLTSSSRPSRALPPLRLPPLISQNRSAALAALEGRSPRAQMDVTRKVGNFMNMSDGRRVLLFP
ncbi:hypothetical protein BC629DRAFT_7227 [Irpex lacteus]|nr:hypothetical protein BC629DRAFT_7227 [Irpex lacteus]